jgi:hypothetical protein
MNVKLELNQIRGNAKNLIDWCNHLEKQEFDSEKYNIALKLLECCDSAIHSWINDLLKQVNEAKNAGK